MLLNLPESRDIVQILITLIHTTALSILIVSLLALLKLAFRSVNLRPKRILHIFIACLLWQFTVKHAKTESFEVYDLHKLVHEWHAADIENAAKE